VVAEDLHYLAESSAFRDRTTIRRSIPGSKAKPVERPHVAGCEPEKTIRRLRNSIRATPGTISRPPGGMDVLGDTFVRIEGANRARQQQHAGKTRAQHRRNRAARPFKAKQKRSARSYVSHVVPE